jgi:hypothetical protein
MANLLSFSMVIKMHFEWANYNYWHDSELHYLGPSTRLWWILVLNQLGKHTLKISLIEIRLQTREQTVDDSFPPSHIAIQPPKLELIREELTDNAEEPLIKILSQPNSTSTGVGA